MACGDLTTRSSFRNSWLVEAGQSATGALLEHIVRMHAAGGEPTAALHQKIVSRIAQLRAEEGDALGSRIFVLPDFHGNRSPLADPHAVGTISGLTLDTSFDGLCALYWRTAVGIALGIRHILEKMKEYGYVPDTLHVAGGHVKNPVLMELYSDATGCRVVVPKMNEAVLLGTAIGASVACGLHKDLTTAGVAMYPGGEERAPDATKQALYDREYRRFLAMYRHRAELDAIQLAIAAFSENGAEFRHSPPAFERLFACGGNDGFRQTVEKRDQWRKVVLVGRAGRRKRQHDVGLVGQPVAVFRCDQHDLVAIAPRGSRQQTRFAEASAIDDDRGGRLRHSGERRVRRSGLSNRPDAWTPSRDSCQPAGEMRCEAREPYMRCNENFARHANHRDGFGPVRLCGQMVDVVQRLDLLGDEQGKRFSFRGIGLQLVERILKLDRRGRPRFHGISTSTLSRP